MTFTAIWETILIIAIGLGGWALFERLKLPVAPFLGSLTVITVLRAVGITLPFSPGWLFPLMQILIGIRIGTMVTRETVGHLKRMLTPAIIVVIWVQAVIFILSPLLAYLTVLDLHTSILSLSMGGVTEIAILALSTDADPGFVIAMQVLRLNLTMSLFPNIFSKWLGEGDLNAASSKEQKSEVKSVNHNEDNANQAGFKKALSGFLLMIARTWPKGLITLLIAALGGGVLFYLNVPAGYMIGATFAIALASLAGIKLGSIPNNAFGLILVGAGISVADNILPDKFAELTDPRLLLPVAVATAFIFISSILVAFLVHRIAGRDLPTSFLAAAPAGFTMMTILAIKYNKDPFFVSMMQLCRILSIKVIIPIVFMYLV